MDIGESKKDRSRCGLCGKTKRLRKTECCGNWICDDEMDYVPFSFAQNSCSRNHSRYTICGFHHTEGHPGHWKDCEKCRNEFPTEMYVWYATNEYNFEKLENPPSYKPTRCAICGRRISLGTDGYTRSGDDYWCETCANRKLGNVPAGGYLEMPQRKTDPPAGRAKVGRNDPCPCGSGKKYKRCCYGKDTDRTSREKEPSDIFADLREAMQDKEFGSLKEVQAFVDWHVGQQNRAPQDDFQGLSPEQMHRFLHFPFSSPDLVAFSPCLATPPEGPAVKLITLLTGAMGEEGIKATVKGNLPLNLVQEAAMALLSDEERKFRGAIRSETHFPDLNKARLVCGLAGLIRKYHGRFLPTSRLKRLVADGGMSAVYPHVLRAFAEKFNWGYGDRYPEFSIIQHSFLFSLRLFHRFGSEWRPSSFYEDCFLKAFPMILDELEPTISYATPEEIVRSCYRWRCIEKFAVFLGLLDIQREDKSYLSRRFTVRKTLLLDEAVTFKV